MRDLVSFYPDAPVTPTLTSSTQSLLQSRKPKELSREEVAALFVSQSGDDLLMSTNWSPELQLAVEKGLDSALAASGLSVAEILFMTFAGCMQNKNKPFFQRQFAKKGKITSIPECGAGRRRKDSKSQSISGSSSSITRLLAKLSSPHGNPRYRRALEDIPRPLHGALYGLAKNQA